MNRQINVGVPIELYKAVRQRALDDGATMREVVTSALLVYLWGDSLLTDERGLGDSINEEEGLNDK